MKKNLSIVGILLLSLSLSAFGYLKWSNFPTKDLSLVEAENIAFGPYEYKPNREFIYSLGNRFATSTTPSQIKNAKTILDLIPKGASLGLSQFENVIVDTLRNNNETGIWGINEELSKAQKKLLNATSYSSNFYFESDCKKMNSESGALSHYDLVYFITVVPEKQAQYVRGNEALIDFLKKGSAKEVENVEWKRLWPGRIGFTVSKKGVITNVITISACGQKGIDYKMLELVKNIPGQWEPAKDDKGNKVAQEFVFFYGLDGC